MLYFIMSGVTFCIFLIVYLVWAKVTQYEPETVEYVFVSTIFGVLSAIWPFTLPMLLLFFFVKFIFTRYISKIVERLTA